MYVETERTPNPATLKFIPDQAVLESGTQYYGDASDAKGHSPMAERLFGVEGVEAVMLGAGFLSVTLADGLDWMEKKSDALSAIMEHYISGDPVIISEIEVNTSEEDSESIQQIKAILDEKVRPMVAQDGGDIQFHDFRDGVVYLKMQGACSGCPSATMTLRHGVENLLKYYVPDVVGVEQV